VAEPFKQQNHRKNAQAAVRFVISKMSPATLLNAVVREILIRSFDVSAVALGNSSPGHILKKRNINFLTTNEDRRVRKHLDGIRVKQAKSQRQT
jgi:hypothetical protein